MQDNELRDRSDLMQMLSIFLSQFIKNGYTLSTTGGGGGNVDVVSSVLPTNAAQETGGNLATLASAVNGAAGAMKVELVGATGTAINITAGDIDVHLLHSGTNPDSVQIGDGTTLLGITTNNEAKVKDIAIGEVQVTPTSNTVLDRLKTIGTNTSVNPLLAYGIAAKDTSDTTYNYFGFIKFKDASWYVLRENKLTGEYLYFHVNSGSGITFDSVSGWALRADPSVIYSRQNTITW